MASTGLIPEVGAPAEVRRFTVAVGVASLVVVLAVLLLSTISPASRAVVSSAGLVATAALAIACGFLRASRTPAGAQRRPWLLMSCAALVPLVGNTSVLLAGAGVGASPTLLVESSIAFGLMVSIIGLLTFPTARLRGLARVVMVFDGLIAGAALLIIFSVLVYPEILESSSRGTTGSPFTLVIPLLDLLLATVSLILILRSPRSQRLTFTMVALGFLLYTVSDLSYAVRQARGTFEFGSLIDVGWIAGYLAFALATRAPTGSTRRHDRSTAGVSDALGVMLVFAVLLVAALVQVVFGGRGQLVGAQVTTWVVLIMAVGARQVALTVDNTTLRRGLERRVSEQTADLSRLARQTELLLESVGDGIYGVDRKGRITFANPHAATTLGYTATELLGRLPQDVLLGSEDGAAPSTWTGSAVQRAISEGVEITSSEEVYRRADGTSFPVESTAAPLVEDAEVVGAVVVFRDVTQRREIDRMKNEFLSVVSHELRTPLTSIRASLELIEGGHLGPLSPDAARMITVAREGSERLSRLINDLLDIERIESGTAPMTITSLDARTLLDHATQHLEGVASASGVQLVVGRAAGRVLADEDQVLQALTNLVGNACKFSEGGTVVTLEAHEGENQVRFTVSDQGRGIPAEKLHAVFERFVQVDSSDTRQKGGTGLGLTITQGIVHRHGGEIWAESAVGVGTTVSFTLPGARKPTPPQPLTTVDPHGATVLVCDDDQAVVDAMSAVLNAHGYRTVGATDGAMLTSLLATEQPAVVLLDLLMPGTTGAEVLETMRDDAETSGIPVVVISGLGPEASPVLADTTEGWLVKPVSEERLVRAVALAMSGRPYGGTVLLVEDDDDLASVLITMLSSEGVEVVRASSATEAILRGQELRPDLVVLDLLLPDGNGIDVVAELQRRGSLAHTPLIVYSGAEIDNESRRALRLGETTFVDKGRTGPRELKEQVLGLLRAATKPHGAEATTTSSSGGNHRGGTSRVT